MTRGSLQVSRVMVSVPALVLVALEVVLPAGATGGSPASSAPSVAAMIESVHGSPCAELLGPCLADSVLAQRPLVLERSGDTLSVSWADLGASSLCMEGPGGFATSAGTAVTGTWAGISLPDLLTQWAGLTDDHSVTFVADDGYRMTFEGSDILDRSEGTWILAVGRDGAPIPASLGLVRAIKIGPSTPMVTGHVSVQGIVKIILKGIAPPTFTLSMRGLMNAHVDRQTLQSCVACHGMTVSVTSDDSIVEYQGVPLFRLLAFSDDSLYAPHRQDSAIISYRRDLAQAGYSVDLQNADGAALTFDSPTLDQHPGIVMALYRNSKELPGDEAPAVVIGEATKGRQPMSVPAVFPGVTSMRLRLP